MFAQRQRGIVSFLTSNIKEKENKCSAQQTQVKENKHLANSGRRETQDLKKKKSMRFTPFITNKSQLYYVYKDISIYRYMYLGNAAETHGCLVCSG